MRWVLMCLLAGLVLTGAAGGEEPVDLSKARELFREESVCGPQFEVVVDHFEPAINGQPGPEDAGDLAAALDTILAQNMFSCPLLQFVAASAIGDREINAALRDLGLAVPFKLARAGAAFRRLALYDARTGSGFFDGLPEFTLVLGFAAPNGLEEGRLWAASLDAKTAEALLAEAHLHQAHDNDLAKYLERMAALKGSPEAAILVARRALADPGFSAGGDRYKLPLGAYLIRAIDAGAEDLRQALQRLYPDWRDREGIWDYVTSGDYSYEDIVLWR